MPFTHKINSQSIRPPLMAGSNAFGGDVVSTSDTKAATPISAGFFRIEKGTPLVYEYPFDEAKFFVEGECIVEDETGQKAFAKPGDVMLIPKGSKITFSTEGYALAFYCDLRAKF